MSLETKEIQEIRDDFALFDDWEDKYAYLIDLGKKLPPFPEAMHIEENKVHGCTAQVWLTHRTEHGAHYFRGDSDAMIVKGLVALLLKIYSGHNRDEISQIDIQPLFLELGLKQYLSPSRSNGFFAMVQRIQELSED